VEGDRNLPETKRPGSQPMGAPGRIAGHRHHHGKQATVYALPHEIDQWLESRSGQELAGQSAKNRQAIPSAMPGPTVTEKGPLVFAVLPLRNLSDGPE